MPFNPESMTRPGVAHAVLFKRLKAGIFFFFFLNRFKETVSLQGREGEAEGSIYLHIGGAIKLVNTSTGPLPLQ